MMARLFNLREGFSAADDGLPERLFSPLRKGKLAGQSLDRRQFEQMMSLYYEMAGWDASGKPTMGKLAELGLAWAVE
jgi:aldehyde:ferredoxin oxidoreductase